jgi:hypothetical protein
MRQTRLYKSSQITRLSYLVSQLEHSLLNPRFFNRHQVCTTLSATSST